MKQVRKIFGKILLKVQNTHDKRQDKSKRERVVGADYLTS